MMHQIVVADIHLTEFEDRSEQDALHILANSHIPGEREHRGRNLAGQQVVLQVSR